MIFSLVTMVSWPSSTIVVSDRSILLTSALVFLILFSHVLHVLNSGREGGQSACAQTSDGQCDQERQELDNEINAAFEESASEGFAFIMDLIDAQAEVKAGNIATVFLRCAQTHQVVPPQILRCLASYISRVEPECRLQIAECLSELKEDTTREVAIVCTALETMIQRVDEPIEVSALGNAMYGLGGASRGRGTARGRAIPRAMNFLQQQGSDDSIRSRESVSGEPMVF